MTKEVRISSDAFDLLRAVGSSYESAVQEAAEREAFNRVGGDVAYVLITESDVVRAASRAERRGEALYAMMELAHERARKAQADCRRWQWAAAILTAGVVALTAATVLSF